MFEFFRKIFIGLKHKTYWVKHISCKCNHKFMSKKCNLNQIWNNDKCRNVCQTSRKNMCGKGYIWNPATCSYENGRYARSITDDSVITCDEIFLTKTVLTNFSEKKMICKKKNFYILFSFLLITMKNLYQRKFFTTLIFL